jgi:hypothetical protein
MLCIGCDQDLPTAAWAIMNEADIPEGREVAHAGPGKFHALSCCENCYNNVEGSRQRILKAHFALPDSAQLFVALGTAGSSGQIGG